MKNVSQRNAPGAISAIALLVSPVTPNVGFISPVASAMYPPGERFSRQLRRIDEFLHLLGICQKGRAWSWLVPGISRMTRERLGKKRIVGARKESISTHKLFVKIRRVMPRQ